MTEKFSIPEVTSKIIDNETEYKRRKAVAKTETRKRHRKSLEEFISRLERAIYKIMPNAIKYLEA